MINATIENGKVYIEKPNNLELYVQNCINDAVERLKGHELVKEDPLKYVIRTILGLDQAHDPEWQPYARFAKDNLADTETAMKFLTEHYQEVKEVVEHMVDHFGNDFYEYTFDKGFDLVRLTVIVYHEIIDQIAGQLNLRDDD